MRKIAITADRLVSSLLHLAEIKQIAILDSCGVGPIDADLLIAGIDPTEVHEIGNNDPASTLRLVDEKLESGDLAGIFTISYDFGVKLQRIGKRRKSHNSILEPNIYLALYDCLVIHNYADGQTFISGNPAKFDQVEKTLFTSLPQDPPPEFVSSQNVGFHSNFTQSQYFDAIYTIKDLIRAGDTYQTNLTQQLTIEVSANLTAARIFGRFAPRSSCSIRGLHRPRSVEGRIGISREICACVLRFSWRHHDFRIANKRHPPSRSFPPGRCSYAHRLARQ